MLGESFDRRKHAAGIVRFATVREEFLTLAYRAGVQIENELRPDAGLEQLVAVCGRKVQVPLAGVVTLCAVGLSKSLRYFKTHLVAALPNAWSNRSQNMFRFGTEFFLQHLNSAPENLGSRSSPSGMDGADCPFTAVKQQDWNAIRRAHSDRSADFIRYKRIALGFTVVENARVANDIGMYLT